MTQIIAKIFLFTVIALSVHCSETSEDRSAIELSASGQSSAESENNKGKKKTPPPKEDEPVDITGAYIIGCRVENLVDRQSSTCVYTNPAGEQYDGASETTAIKAFDDNDTEINISDLNVGESASARFTFNFALGMTLGRVTATVNFGDGSLDLDSTNESIKTSLPGGRQYIYFTDAAVSHIGLTTSSSQLCRESGIAGGVPGSHYEPVLGFTGQSFRIFLSSSSLLYNIYNTKGEFVANRADWGNDMVELRISNRIYSGLGRTCI